MATNPGSIRVFRKHLRAIEREVEYQLKDQTLCCSVTSAQCHVLLELADLGASNLIDLSQQLRLDSSTLSRRVDGLVRAGYVDRTIDPMNRRYVQLGLTARGRRKVESIDRTCNRFYLSLLREVPGGRQGELVESVRLLAEIFARARRGERGAADPARECGRRGRKHAEGK